MITDESKIDTSGANAPICGLHACHVLTGRSVEHIKRWYRKRFNKSDRWKGSTYQGNVLHYLRRWRTVKEVRPQFKTVGKFVEMETTKKERYVIWVSGHVISIVNGKIIDQGGARLPHESRNRHRRIKSVYRVTSKKKR